jgi:hypothetical protein
MNADRVLRIGNVDHRSSIIDHRSSIIDHRSSIIDHRSSIIESILAHDVASARCERQRAAQRTTGWVTSGDSYHGRVVDRRRAVEMAPRFIAIRWSTDGARDPSPRSQARVLAVSPCLWRAAGGMAIGRGAICGLVTCSRGWSLGRIAIPRSRGMQPAAERGAGGDETRAVEGGGWIRGRGRRRGSCRCGAGRRRGRAW